ncbi:taste receptor type 1 member 3 isoform X1 [Poecile atricapillus]|uniref:taste receptor type 1 member 3 isoform X1 n=1 Tax=Poecile atricapillus TaxID=48891 RepID=UPI0027386199|nr:taste receptor type 1 member 3 isoform X1 [Poecile atricapillus]
MKLPGLWLCLSFGSAASLSPSCLSAQFRRPGDFILGGLFPFGKDTVNLTARSEPTLPRCERLFMDGLIWALGMRFAIDQINNSSSLLPGIKLGYDMYDTCFEPLVALQPSLLFLTRNGTTGIGILCNYTEYQPRITAIIGPHKSDLCLLTAKLFSSFLIPQVSYGASSETLSNTELYPSFYRTVPSDKNLVEAVVRLLNQFGWNWIATVGSDDEYGRGAQALFLSMAGNDNICIAFEGFIPTDLAEPNARKQLEDTVKLINSTKVNVVVLFAYSLPAQALLEHSIRMGLGKKVWIGTEAWMLSDVAAYTPNIQSIGTVLGFVSRTGTVPGFQEYVAELFSSVEQEKFCQQSRELSRLMNTEVLDTHCQQCDHVTLGDIWPLLRVTMVQPVHVAVYSVAHALHRALGCTSEGCPKTPIRSWQVRKDVRAKWQVFVTSQTDCHNLSPPKGQLIAAGRITILQTRTTVPKSILISFPPQLLHFMNTLPFEVNGQSFRFDQSHGTNTGYKLIFWAWRDGTLTYLPVGDYDQSLYIQKSQIQFHTADKKVTMAQFLLICLRLRFSWRCLADVHSCLCQEPTSECFRRCQPGQFRRIKGFNLCCYDCTDCSENTFWSSTDSTSCSPCPQHQWAPARSTRCHERTERFLFWDEPMAVALMTLMALTVALSCLSALLFLKHLQTPLVQVAGGGRTLFALLWLLLQSLSCCLYVGRPSARLCAVQQLSYALCLNGCFSTFVPKALEISLLTEFPRCAPRLLRWVTHGRAWLLVATSLLTQALLCFCHLRLGPDYLVADYKSLPSEVVLVCGTQSWAAFALLHGYNSCLAFACFLCTFMVQTPARRYNVARGITFATLIYFIIWIFFVVVFATLRTVLRAVTQICTIQATTLGILASYFVPKCYIMVFRPDLNTGDYCQNPAEEQPEEDSVNRQ